jgi:hypothetical protein
MRTGVRLAHISVLVAILAVCTDGFGTSSGIEVVSASDTAEQAKLIHQAGERMKVPVRTERMVYVAQAGALLVSAPAANLEGIPATELPHGVNLGISYFDLPGQKIPKGYYKMRVLADVKQVGRIEGRVQIINAKGEIVAQLPATIEVKSMTVPKDSKPQLTSPTLCTGTACSIGAGNGTPSPGARLWLCFSCTNGFIVCCQLPWYFPE